MISNMNFHGRKLLFFWIDYEFLKLHRESVYGETAFLKLEICDYKIRKKTIMNSIKKNCY